MKNEHEKKAQSSQSNPKDEGQGIGRRSVLVGGLAGLGAAAVGGLPRFARAQPKTIPVGVVVGLTGNTAAWGRPVVDATKLAIDEINKAGGIKSKGGAKIELVIADHQSNPQMSGTQTERVIQVNDVICVIGNASSGCTIVGTAASERNKTPHMSTDSGASLSARGFKYYFRMAIKTTALGKIAVDFARDTAKATGIGPKKVAILADDTTFSQDAAKALLENLKGTGWPVFENVSWGPGTVSDFSPILQRLKLGGVDLLFQANFAPDGIQIQRALKKLNYDPIAAVHVLGAPYTPEFQNAMGKDANFLMDAVGFVPELVDNNPLLKQFAGRYQAAYGRILEDQASLAAAIVGNLYEALERTKDLTRESLAETLRATDLQPGANPYLVRGGVKYDENGDNVRSSPFIMQIQEEKQRIVYPASMATAKLVWPMPKWKDRA